jgi:acetyl esterase/lipase
MSNLNIITVRQFWWLFPLILSILGLFLSLWIIIPAPTFFLLIFGVGAPELSPWLVVVNAIALFSIATIHKSWLSNLILVCSLIGLVLSLLPLLQLPAANQRFNEEMEKVLGIDYLARIPQDLQQQMRPEPFAIADVFRGIAIPKVRVDRDIVFASPDGVKLKLNLYRPLALGKNPTLVIIYGGAWRSGSPNDYEQFSSYIAAQGYSVITIDYRHAPKYQFPVQLEDVQTGLNYIQNHADDLEVDPNRIGIMGRSAGGHLATLAAYQQDAITFRSVVSYYSPVDLTEGYYDPPIPDPIDISTVLKNFLGGTPKEFPALYHQASPINYPRPNLPPSLLIYGKRDHLVQAKFGQQLYDKLKETGNSAILLSIPWAEHAFDVVFLGVSNQLALYYTERFLALTLKPAEV